MGQIVIVSCLAILLFGSTKTNLLSYKDTQQELYIYKQRIGVVRQLLAVECPNSTEAQALVPNYPVHIEVMKWVYNQLVETLVNCRKSKTSASTTTTAAPDYLDCQDLFENGHNISGVYKIKPSDRTIAPFRVWCDFIDGHGYTVIQRRGNKSVSFDRNWADYKSGFGDIEGEHWLGNDKIYLLTRQNQQLNINLTAASGKRGGGIWKRFFIADDTDHFRIKIDGRSHSGDLYDAFSEYHDGMMFTTKDSDNDLTSSNCAKEWKGGWWYAYCYRVNLNGDRFSTSWNYFSASLIQTVMRVTRG